MAIQVMTEVWEHSQATGTRLLILLALADRARKEDGVCWPGIAALAQQARVTSRDVHHHIGALQGMGELRIVRRGGRGPRDTSVYQVTVGRYKDATVCTLHDGGRVQPPSVKGQAGRVQRVTPSPAATATDKGEPGSGKRVQPPSPDPLLTDLDPSEPTEPSAVARREGPEPLATVVHRVTGRLTA